jgi:putative oxidoreductase
MSLLLNLTAAHAALGRLLDHFRSALLLATRCYVGWQFWKSGWLKVSAWSSTLDLFRNEYHVPVLPPEVAAVMGAGGEIFFPALLFVGLFGRVGALGASFVNVMAVISYRQVLLAEGSEAALAQHVLWGFMLLVLTVFGPGAVSIDRWLERRNAARCRPFSPAVPA